MFSCSLPYTSLLKLTVLERSGSVNRSLVFLFDWPLTSVIIPLRKTILKYFKHVILTAICSVTCSKTASIISNTSVYGLAFLVTFVYLKTASIHLYPLPLSTSFLDWCLLAFLALRYSSSYLPKSEALHIDRKSLLHCKIRFTGYLRPFLRTFSKGISAFSLKISSLVPRYF